jgi:hypothetical protein
VIVANERCGFKANDSPLNVAVAKLGQDLADFMPESRYAPVVEVKMKKAIEYITARGRPGACEGMEEVLLKFLPDIYDKAALMQHGETQHRELVPSMQLQGGR